MPYYIALGIRLYRTDTAFQALPSILSSSSIEDCRLYNMAPSERVSISLFSTGYYEFDMMPR